MSMIPIKTCKNEVEASFIKAKLEIEGIGCFLTNESTATLLPHLFMSDNAGVKVFINENDAERAKKILAETEE